MKAGGSCVCFLMERERERAAEHYIVFFCLLPPRLVIKKGPRLLSKNEPAGLPLALRLHFTVDIKGFYPAD